MQSRKQGDALKKKWKQQPLLSLFCCRRGLGGGARGAGVYGLSLGIGEGCRALQSVLGSGGAWSANVCVCETHTGE